MDQVRTKIAMASTMVLLTLATSACSAVSEGPYAFDQGWREARVERIASAQENLGSPWHDCRKELSPDQLASTQFAVLVYAHLRSVRRVVVPTTGGTHIAVGDAVYDQVNTCNAPQPKLPG